MLTQILESITGPLLPAVLVVLKSTMVLLLAIGLTTLMRRASATSRHLVWTASLFALLAIPALAVWSPIRFAVLPSAWVADAVGPRPPAPVTGDERAMAIGAPAAGIAADAGAAPLPAGSATVTAGGESPRPPLAPEMIVLLVWGAVAFALLARLALGAHSVRRITRAAVPLAAPEWQGALFDIADRLGMSAAPTLLRSTTVTMPFACGLREPTIVLPTECDDWTSDRRSAVLLHELAHIRRRDIVGHAVGRVACALYWFHPLAWMAARRMRAESERACDDLALSCGTRASDYAEHLLDIVTSVRSHATPSMAMAMATRSEFEGRMLAILDPSLTRTAPTRVQASTLAGGVMMFAIVAGSVVPRHAVPASPDDPRFVDTRASLMPDSTRGDSAASQAAKPDAFATRIAAPVPAPMTSSEPVMTAPEAAEAQVVGDSSARASVLARILRTDSAANLRRTAAWGLQDFTGNEAALDALLHAVRRDPSAGVREMAAWALAEAAEENRVGEVLAEVLRQEPDRSVRESVVWSLAEGAGSRSTSAIAALVSVLGDPDAEVREMAAWGLGNASPKRAPSELLTLLSDRNARVRRIAAWALFQIEDAETADAIDTALQKEMDADARWAMIRALSVMGDRAVVPLQRLIESSNAATRALAIRALAGQGADPWPQPRPRPRPFP